MTTENRFASAKRDQQDATERHVWGAQTHSDTGAFIKVRGTGTEDKEAVVINGGYSFHLPENTNTEVLLLASSADTNLKYALLTIPRDKQHPWGEGEGGVQNPTDPDKRLEFNAKRTHLTEDNAAIGNGVIEVIGGTIYLRGNVSIEGDLRVTGDLHVGGTLNSVIPTGSPSPTVVPGFSA